MENSGELVRRVSSLAIDDTSKDEEDGVLVEIDEYDKEIALLRERLADYAVREAQLRQEKYDMEQRVASMRLLFDQHQQDLIDASSKAIAYRQDIIEENIRLAYALQDAREETSTFVYSLMPLLAGFSLQPPVADAQSIVSNLRFLFAHFKEKIKSTEAKLRESQYLYGERVSDMMPSSSGQLREDANAAAESQNQYGRIVSDMKPSTSAQLQQDAWADMKEPASEKEPLVSSPYTNATNSSYAQSPEPSSVLVEKQNRDQSSSRPLFQFFSEAEKPSTSSYLPSILEEPSSSIPEPEDEEDEDGGSEDGTDYDDSVDDENKPLPAIEGLQILGEAIPGRELQASGYSTNGTTHCGFEWVRHLEDGSVNYIEWAKTPNYIVTADDVDAYLAVEVQPLDDKERMGELVKCFANGNKKIPCPPEMRHHIESSFTAGQGHYRLFMLEGTYKGWVPVTLEIKREGYSIKLGTGGVVVTEKFSEATYVSIPSEPDEFLIVGSGGVERCLRTENGSSNVSCSRDTIVLTLRFFIKRAVERKRAKKKKRVFFFK